MSQRAVTAVVSMAARSRSAVNRSTSSPLIPWLHRWTVDYRCDLMPSLKGGIEEEDATG
jgi:hypothetical protein